MLFPIDFVNICLFSIFYLIDSARWKELFSIVCVNIYLFSIFFFNRFCPMEKCEVTPNYLYRHSLTLNCKFGRI